MSNRNNSWTHKGAAVICLVAVLLLQAPFASAAWLSSSMACCMGDHCPVPSHHHKPAASQSEMPMDCGHHSNKVPECKMSCCKSTDEAAINVSLFLIPSPQVIRSIESVLPAVSQLVPQMLSRSEKPQSPPPRTLLS